METPHVVLPLYHFQPKFFKPSQVIIPPRVCQKVKVPVNETLGIDILNYVNFGKAEMPQCLVKIVDSFAFTVIANSSENSVKITFTEPFQVELIEKNELKSTIDLNCFEKMDIDEDELDNLQRDILNKLRLDHCNKEEYEAIKNLCYE